MSPRFDANPKGGAVSLSANLLHNVFYVVNRTLTKSLCVMYGVLNVRFLVLISTPKYAQKKEHIILKHLFMESGM